eukprot:3436806-Prymnesium_polylepis.1
MATWSPHGHHVVTTRPRGHMATWPRWSLDRHRAQLRLEHVEHQLRITPRRAAGTSLTNSLTPAAALRLARLGACAAAAAAAA